MKLLCENPAQILIKFPARPSIQFLAILPAPLAASSHLLKSLRPFVFAFCAFPLLASSVKGQQPEAAPVATAPAPASATPEAQAPASAPPATDAQTPQPAAAPEAAAPPAPQTTPSPEVAPVTEDELRQQLVGRQLFLRGGFLGDVLNFNQHGDPLGHPISGSYTLSAVEITKVHIDKRKVELEGIRYGLHFLGALPSEDPSKAVDRVRITPKKKVLKITIDREQVIKPKKEKEPRKGNEQEKEKNQAPPVPGAKSGPESTVASSETDTTVAAATSAPSTPPAAPETPHAPGYIPEVAVSATSTTSQAHANQLLRESLDRIFAPGLDARVMEQMPDFWKLYYQAQAAGVDYRPADPKVLRANAVDQQAKVITTIAPDSNEYAQASGIAGRALYRAVIGPDGKANEIAVVRPIGFGLDEKSVDAIRKASFIAAVKDGQPVSETLDLAVLFRIYSKRTNIAAAAAEAKPVDSGKQVLPGPYTIRAPKQDPPQEAPKSGGQPSDQPANQPASDADNPPIVIDTTPAPKPQ